MWELESSKFRVGYDSNGSDRGVLQSSKENQGGRFVAFDCPVGTVGISVALARSLPYLLPSDEARGGRE